MVCYFVLIGTYLVGFICQSDIRHIITFILYQSYCFNFRLCDFFHDTEYYYVLNEAENFYSDSRNIYIGRADERAMCINSVAQFPDIIGLNTLCEVCRCNIV